MKTGTFISVTDDHWHMNKKMILVVLLLLVMGMVFTCGCGYTTTETSCTFNNSTGMWDCVETIYNRGFLEYEETTVTTYTYSTSSCDPEWVEEGGFNRITECYSEEYRPPTEPTPRSTPSESGGYKVSEMTAHTGGGGGGGGKATP